MGLRDGDIAVCLKGGGNLMIVFYEDESEFDGNDFEYQYSLNSENTAAFLKKIPHHSEEVKENIEVWMVENGLCDWFGYDLLQKWIQMGLHGSHVVWEDYPGGIYREEEF